MKSDITTDVGLHIFERAGCGKAPYRFIGISEEVYQACPDAPVQAGGNCDYCGTGLRNKYWLLSADGRKFGVGCDCIEKSGDAGLIKAYKNSPEVRAANRAKIDARNERVADELATLMVDNAETLKAISKSTWNGTQESQYDYLARVIPWCGAAGRARCLKHIRVLLTTS